MCVNKGWRGGLGVVGWLREGGRGLGDGRDGGTTEGGGRKGGREDTV